MIIKYSLILFLFIIINSTINIFARRGQRIQYHEQGIQGIHSYRYGYETGDTFNPQIRHEERDSNGVVKGYYSYKDPYGLIQVTHYLAHPRMGFKILKTQKFRPRQ